VNIVVTISDARVSSDPEAVLVTYSLGSCIGATFYDPVVRVGGLLHFQLPTSTLDAAKGRANPFMFADTGVRRLLDDMAALGVQERRLQISLAGAAQMLNDSALFNIGRRNHTAIRKVLWQQGMFITREEIGGGQPRNVYLRMSDGAVHIKSVGIAAAAA
jgi:chemotaxis protein CheD